MKRTLRILFLALLTALTVCTFASAAKSSGTCGDNLTWVYDEATCTLTISGSGAMEDYSNAYNYDPAVGDIVYYDRAPWYTDYAAVMKTLVVEEGVTSIGNYAFNGCSALQIITLPASLTSIGEDAFFGCAALTGITIPASVTAIGANAFQSCTALTSIAIPDGITAIKDQTFYYCQSLKTVTVPRSLASVGINAFSGCYALETVTYGGTREDRALISIDERNNDCFTDAHWDCIPSTFGTCGSALSWVLDETTGTLTVSGSGAMEDYDYRNPAPWNYYAAAITSAVMEEGVTAIGDRAFDGCVNLTAVTLPKSLTAVGESAFLSSCYLADVRYGGSEENRSAITLEEGNTWLNMARWTYAFALTVTDVRFAWVGSYPMLCWTAPKSEGTLHYRVCGIDENGSETEILTERKAYLNLISLAPKSLSHIRIQILDDRGALLGETGDTGMYITFDSGSLPAPEIARILPREDGTLAYEAGPYPNAVIYCISFSSNGTAIGSTRGSIGADGFLRWEHLLPSTLDKINTEDLWLSDLTVFDSITFTDDGLGAACSLRTCPERVQLKLPPAEPETPDQPDTPAVGSIRYIAPDANVTIYDGIYTTDDNGVTSFTPSKQGTYTLTAKKAGCLTYTVKDITVGSEDIDLGELKMLAGDLNADDKINMSDLRTFLNNFNKTGANISEPLADFDGNSKVNMSDLRVFLSNFNKTAAKDCTYTYGA